MPRRRMPASPSQADDRTDGQPCREPPADPETSTDTRVRILHAAKQLFASRGFDATPTKEIASLAGVPSGLVFYYFPTKRSLLLAIVRERGFLPELRAALQAEMAFVADPRAELTSVGYRMVEFLERNQEIARILVHEAISHPEVEAELRRLRVEGVRVVADYIEEAIRRGSLRPGESEVLARLFAAGILVGVLDRPSDSREEVRRIVEALLRGLVVEDSS